MTMKWWGWGAPDKAFAIDARPNAWPWLQSRLRLPDDAPLRTPVDPAGLQLPPCRLPPAAYEALTAALGEINVTTQAADRLTHSYGKSYQDLVRIRAGDVPNPPDAVLFPTQESHVEAILAIANEHAFAVIPFGGGSSVVGGLEMPPEQRDRPFVSLDLAKMAELIAVDPVSLIATAQPGILGPRLEEALAAHGVILGHAPQSFEFSTLGGWVATRSAGQQSTRYGKIEELVVGMRVVTPTGTLVVQPRPAAAEGPDLAQIAIGSEGTLGVITEATVKVRKLPERRHYRALLFPSWQAGLDALRDVMQGDRHPATFRLSDNSETEITMKLADPGQPTQVGSFMRKVMSWYLQRVRRVDPTRGCLLMLGFEGSHDEVEHDLAVVRDRLETHRAFDLGTAIGDRWYRERFELPYLRDTLLDRGLLIDTLETSTTWALIPTLYEAIKTAIEHAIRADGLEPLVFCHVSHPYAAGASLYFTMVTAQLPGQEIEQWRRYKRAASEAIATNGGTLSHHHGVGLDHAPWAEQRLGAEGVRWIDSLKHAADPAGVMNPAKITRITGHGH